MMPSVFSSFFYGDAKKHLLTSIRESLAEDGEDLTSNSIFSPDASLFAIIIAKQDAVLAGMPILPLILEETAKVEPGAWHLTVKKNDGEAVAKGDKLCEIEGSARVILRAERILLNFLCHLSGIATLVSKYVAELEGTSVRLLDTRKTLPGLRYPEKYAVLMGGGVNHRMTLSDLLMLKDNHIDAAGNIENAVERLAMTHPKCPVEVECSSLEQVDQAVSCGVYRIMLDNMPHAMIVEALDRIPRFIEVEISGNITLENIRSYAVLQASRYADFISVGRLTHSAPYADFSMRIAARGWSAYSRLS